MGTEEEEEEEETNDELKKELAWYMDEAHRLAKVNIEAYAKIDQLTEQDKETQKTLAEQYAARSIAEARVHNNALIMEMTAAVLLAFSHFLEDAK